MEEFALEREHVAVVERDLRLRTIEPGIAAQGQSGASPPP